jgi:hypothetical protein
MQQESGYIFEGSSSEENSFEKGIQLCEETLEDVFKQGLDGDEFDKRIRTIERQYIDLVCQAEEKEFMRWYDNNAKKLLKDMFNRGNTQNDDLLVTKFLLCKKAREIRESMEGH